MHGLIYSPKVQNFCIITYNLFTRLVGIVPNEGFACFMMTVKDYRRSTNNIVFDQLVDGLILVAKEMEFSLGISDRIKANSHSSTSKRDRWMNKVNLSFFVNAFHIINC